MEEGALCDAQRRTQTNTGASETEQTVQSHKKDTVSIHVSEKIQQQTIKGENKDKTYNLINISGLSYGTLVPPASSAGEIKTQHISVWN